MDFQKEVAEPVTKYFQNLELYGIIGWSLISLGLILLIIAIIL